jgi:hypothetical protein
VAGGGGIARLDGHHARAHEAFEELLDLVVQERVVDRRRRLSAQRGEQLFVFPVERLSVEPVERLQHAHHLALDRSHGDAEDAARLVAGLLVHRLVEARVLVRVGNVHRGVGLRHRAGDAAAHGEADLLGADALRDLAPQLAALVVDEEERAAVGLHHPGGGADDQLQQTIEVALGDQRLRNIEDSSELLDPLAKLLHRARSIPAAPPGHTKAPPRSGCARRGGICCG